MKNANSKLLTRRNYCILNFAQFDVTSYLLLYNVACQETYPQKCRECGHSLSFSYPRVN